MIGFLFRNSHGIHAYGTNTKEQQIDFGAVRSWRSNLEVSFAFNCWLGVDQYTISLAVHSREGQAYDWLDAALFLRVTSMSLTEGIANLNASVTANHRTVFPSLSKGEVNSSELKNETLTYG